MILGKHTIIKLIFLILAVLALSSCSARNKAEATTPPDETEILEEDVPTPEAEARETIYIYKEHPEQVSSDKITLVMNNDPLLLPDGYVRLVGVVSGGKPIAVIEVGGRGRIVGGGDKMGEYRVARIFPQEILLVKGEVRSCPRN